jgi:ribosomal protein S18 acetylase RimI-like enzyme
MGRFETMNNEYDFCLAHEKDISAIMNFYHGLIGIRGCTWNLDYPHETNVTQDIGNNSLYLLKEKNNIIAVAAAGVSNELQELQWSIKNPCDLARIGVSFNRQNKGIGTIMLNMVINAVKKRGFDGIRMIVSKNNTSALALYNKNGFIKCGETNMYNIDFCCYEMIF